VNTTYTYQITVPSGAIDALGHVNNVVYLEWVQEAAKQAWESKTDQSNLATQYAWVALDHHISYHAPAFKGEVLEVSTFVKTFKGAKSERHTTITRLKDAKLLTSAITNWCLLKMPEGRPVRVPSEVMALF